MTRLFVSTALLALMLGAAPASAQCAIGSTTEATDADRSVVSTAVRRDLRELRDAASILYTYGREEACQSVMAAIEEIRQDRAGKRARTGDEAYTNDNFQADIKTAVGEATPITQLDGRLTTSRLIGADVVSADGEMVGEISNIVFQPGGQPSHVIVAFGGFIGLGEDRVAVPYDQIGVRKNQTEDLVFFIPLTNEQLQKAPRIDVESDDWLGDDGWISTNKEFFDKNIRPQ